MKMKTKRLKEIHLNDYSSWSSARFITFDIDWAEDFIIQDTLEILDRYALSATFFATGRSNLIDEISSNALFEIGIHPNFNPLLFEEQTNTCASKIVSELKEDFPNAVSVRSHSLTHNERLLDIFSDHGLINICNYFLPVSNNLEVQPFYLWNNLQMIPHRFQDNVTLKVPSPKPVDLLDTPGLVVFNFHPIHLYLNTSSLKQYEDAKPFYRDRQGLEPFRYKGPGLRTDFINMCERLNQVS